MESALLLFVPEADPIVAPYRHAYDLSARDGIPAHVTLLYPFVPPADITQEVLSRIDMVLSSHSAFDARFSSVGRFGNRVLFLRPDEADPFKDITYSLVQEFSAHPPYGGAFDQVIPHLTVADDATSDVLPQIEEELTPSLPVDALCQHVVLMQGHVGSPWKVRHRFTLKGDLA